MQVELQTIKEQVALVANRLLEVANLREGDVFVLGCSSSEICGGQIGKASSAEVGQTVIEALLPILKEKGLYLAVQGCEHINRALVIERAAAEKYGFEIVTVKPALHAGGACSVAAYERFDDPVMVEHCGGQGRHRYRRHLHRPAHQTCADSGAGGHHRDRRGARHLRAQPSKADRRPAGTVSGLIFVA